MLICMKKTTLKMPLEVFSFSSETKTLSIIWRIVKVDIDIFI